MALARRGKGASKRTNVVEQLEQVLEETEATEEMGSSEHVEESPERSEIPEAAPSPMGDGETQRGALLILGLGGTFVVMGLGLVLGRELGYTGRVGALTDIGLSPGGFVFTGLVLCACSLVLRSFTALSHRIDDLETTQSARTKRALRAATSGAISEETLQLWSNVDENVRTLMACREGEREESARSATFIRDSEIKIDTIKRTLEETHRRVLEVHHQVGEGLGGTSVADLAPQLRESLERLLHERTSTLTQEMRTQADKAVTRTQERMDALATQVEKQLAKGGKSDGAAIEHLKNELERTRDELGKSIEQLAGKSGAASPQVAELKQDLREVLRRCEQIERELKTAPRHAAAPAASAASPASAPAAPAPAPAPEPAVAAAAAPAGEAGSSEPTAAVASAIARLRQMKT
ncbi:MAG: hypothetical protein IPN34_05840 [Planctomycetes bacterium]|nr:hypothetical protein [Planctomycetota bacterium]